MAKSLAERITSAKSTDRVTITDLEALIADATAERDRLVGSAEHHDEESINYALSDDDREEASRLASHYQRTARGLSKEIEALTEKLTDKRNSEKQKAEEARIAAIVAKRDELAARLKERLPALFDELVGLLEEIEVNDEEIKPLRLESAEAIARGVNATFYTDCSPIPRFLTMKIPEWGSNRLRWPIDRHALRMNAMYVRQREQMIARQEAERIEAARWKRYAVAPPEGRDRPTIKTQRGNEMVRRPMEAMLTEEGAIEARKAGCQVVELRPNERIGQISGMAVL